MPLTRNTLIALSSSLSTAGKAVQGCEARAQSASDVDLAERLHDIADLIANEVDYIDRLLLHSRRLG